MLTKNCLESLLKNTPLRSENENALCGKALWNIT